MATVFEVIIPEADAEESYAGQAAQEVFREVDRLEEELSRFRDVSDIWRINHLTAGQTTPVGLATMDCLELSIAVHGATQGAFDITVGPLMQAYFNQDGSPRQPSPEHLEYLASCTGMQRFEYDADGGTVTVRCDYPVLDLGAVGKGYALDQAAQMLEEWSVHNALLNAGDSTVLGIGNPPDEPGWVVTAGNKELQPILLKNRALSGSGFAVKGAHIMDPRTLRPVPLRPERVWASAPTAALSDALSTAFMVMDREAVEEFVRNHPEIEAVLD